MRGHRRTTVRVLVAATAAGVLLTGCSGLRGTGDLTYVEGLGNVEQVPVDERGAAVEVSGEALQGGTIDLADLRGRVTVVNVWASWCGPCVAETPLLVEAAAEFDANFVGINVKDNEGDALAFDRANEVTYDSISDYSSSTLTSFGDYTPRSMPSTVILDEEGRVAALVSGEIDSAGVLEGLIEDASVAADPGTEAPSGG